MAHQFTNTPWRKRVDRRSDAVVVVIVDPVSKTCIECGAEFFHRYPPSITHPHGRLKTPERWRRALYCGRECCGAYRGRMSKGVPKRTRVDEALPPYLRDLEPERSNRR